MKGVSCGDLNATTNNVLLDGGCIKVKGDVVCGYDDANDTKGRCTKTEADYVFMFLTFALSAISVGLGLLTNGRRSGNKAMV